MLPCAGVAGPVPHSFPRSVARILACALASVDLLAQTPAGTQAYPSNYPPALPHRKGDPPPRLVFERVLEVPLPGRLLGAPPTVENSHVRIALLGSVARVALDAGADAPVETASAPNAAEPSPSVSEWVAPADGKYRFQARADGHVIGEKRHRRGFKERWRLEVPGLTPSPPLLLGRRLFFATRDDQVHCVRADNGHRVWAVDVSDRVSRPLALWSGDVTVPGVGPELPTRRVELVLVASDRGGALMALDPYDGSRVAVFEVPPAEGKLATGVATTDRGEIVVGREAYAESGASLLVLRMANAPETGAEPAGKPPLPYGKVPRPGTRR